MIPGEWQPVPGCAGASVFPYVRRPDVLSCNSYWLAAGGGLALVDCGALPSQTRELRGIVAASAWADAGDAPMDLLLTHCHYDHAREAAAWLADAGRPVVLAAHEAGADALAAGDPRRTAAELYGEAPPPAKVRRILLAGGATSEWIELGGGLRIEALACPGHTPDSVCYRAGRLLFIGDLLLAGRPLVAGVCGWDRRAWRESLRRVAEMLAGGEVETCCPGHGDPLPAAKALDVVRRMLAQPDAPDEIEDMNPQRLFRTVEVALDLIEEAETAFASVEGRLLYVAERLDGLEEPDAARRCREAMDMEGIDEQLRRFRELCLGRASGSVPQVAFAVEALGVVEKIKRLFRTEPMEAVLPSRFVRRAQRLLLDFIALAQGVRNPEEFLPVSLADSLAGIGRAWRADPGADDTVWDALEAPDGFAADLARRIGRHPERRRMPVRFATEGGGGETSWIAPQRFEDAALQFLEWLGICGATGARVTQRGSGLDVEIEGRLPGESPQAAARLRSFGRRFALCGFELRARPGGYRLAAGNAD
jgi:glyoxylase-like metal-dependent hydrolase (beta-lactamase superfamily II)